MPDETRDHIRPPILVGEPDPVLRRAIVRALSSGRDRIGVIVEAGTLSEATRCVMGIPRLGGMLVEAEFPDGATEQLLDRTRERHGKCPVLVTSRSLSARDRYWVLEHGAAFLAKPALAGTPLRRFARDCLTRFELFESEIRSAVRARLEMRGRDEDVLSGLLAGWTRSASVVSGVPSKAYMSFIARLRDATGVTVRELRTAPLELLVEALKK